MEKKNSLKQSKNWKIDFIDSENIWIKQAQKAEKTILCEGAQGSLLDVDLELIRL
jgi:adenylosuccinate synthase